MVPPTNGRVIKRKKLVGKAAKQRAEKRMTNVCIAIPAGDAYVHARLVKNLLPQIKDNTFLIVSGVSPLAHARNIIVEQFLNTGCEYLWQIDADTIPPIDTLERMLAVDKDIVTAVTPIIRENSRTSNIYLDLSGKPLSMEAVKKRKEPFKIQGVGGACILVKRHVFEKMTIPYYAEVWGNDGRHIDPDIFWGNVAQDEGFEITCIPSIVCGHDRSVIL